MSTAGSRSGAVSHDEPIVMDLGSSVLRVGHCYQIAPQYATASVVGQRRSASGGVNTGSRAPSVAASSSGGDMGTALSSGGGEYLVGADALGKRAILDLQWPIDQGRIVAGLDAVEALMRGTLGILRMNPAKSPLVLTEPLGVPPSHRRALCELAFDRLRAPSLLVVPQGVAGMFACGSLNGFVLDSGHHISQVVGVVEGVALPPTFVKTERAGHMVSKHVAKLLCDASVPSAIAHAEAQRVKEECCCVRPSLLANDDFLMEDDATRVFRLPDNHTVSLTAAQRHAATEVLFSRGSHHASMDLPSAVAQAASAVDDLGLRESLCRRLVVCGGNSMFRGFDERIIAELNAAARRGGTTAGGTAAGSYATRYIDASSAPCDRNWIGAAIVAATEAGASAFVTAADYAERGPDASLAKFRPAVFD